MKERELLRHLRRECLESRNAEWADKTAILDLYPTCSFPPGTARRMIPWYTSGFQ